MRAIIFRVLAGLLAVAFVAVLAMGDTSKMSIRQQLGTGAIALAFGIYALLGSDYGERLLSLVFGGRISGNGEPPVVDQDGQSGAAPGRRPN